MCLAHKAEIDRRGTVIIDGIDPIATVNPVVTSTAAQTSGYTAIQIVSGAVFTSITGTGISGTWTGTTIPAGFTIVGRISAFTLTSGTVIAYLARA